MRSSGIAQCTSSISELVGCQTTRFTGEWCIRAETNAPDCMDQIQIVVGIASVFVASSVSPILRLKTETPCRGLVSDFRSAGDTDGLTGSLASL